MGKVVDLVKVTSGSRQAPNAAVAGGDPPRATSRRSQSPRLVARRSDVEQEVADVTVLENIGLAFGAHPARGADRVL